ncbi:MAG: DUF1573 domain-containing protein [Bacteroidia bacterium]|nr:DUF1573 domain-containing protein [Bacteroidia bacterium]
MKRSSNLILLAILLLGTSCEAQKPAGDVLDIEGGSTKHFGTVTHKDRLEHNFVLRNKGADTIRITDVKAACGCTAVMVSGSTVAPGGSATVSVQFTPPRTTNGHVSKSVSVYAEGAGRPVYVLRIEADVLSAFEAEPALVDVGSSAIGKAVTATFRLKNRSDQTQSIMAVQSALAIEYRGLDGDGPPEVRPLDGVTIEPKEFELAAGASRDITVRFTPSFGGKVMGSAVFYAADETRQVEFTGLVKRK